MTSEGLPITMDEDAVWRLLSKHGAVRSVKVQNLSLVQNLIPAVTLTPKLTPKPSHLTPYPNPCTCIHLHTLAYTYIHLYTLTVTLIYTNRYPYIH